MNNELQFCIAFDQQKENSLMTGFGNISDPQDKNVDDHRRVLWPPFGGSCNLKIALLYLHFSKLLPSLLWDMPCNPVAGGRCHVCALCAVGLQVPCWDSCPNSLLWDAASKAGLWLLVLPLAAALVLWRPRPHEQWGWPSRACLGCSVPFCLCSPHAHLSGSLSCA